VQQSGTRSGPGFFGKLPSRGDFVHRGLPHDFISRWDAWLQDAIASSEAALGERWLETYLTSPIWRYALSPGLCGEQTCFGVLMPSVDKVGRYFPLTAAAICGEAPAALALTAELRDWYLAIETATLATLAETPLELDAFDECLARAGMPCAAAVHGGVDRAGAATDAVPALWHCSMPSLDCAEEALLARLGEAVGRAHGAFGIWWTQGSELIAPCVLVSTDLPAPSAFVAMLDGRWADRGWATSALARAERRSDARPASAPWTPTEGDEAPPNVLAFRSAAISDAGKARTLNEDAFVSRDDLGLWVVADGLGGHAAGDQASRMVAQAVETALAERDGRETNDRLTRVAVALRAVNVCLRVLADRHAERVSASTVAALLVENGDCTWVWAGDSRIYRLRDESLEQLTRDHTDPAAFDDHSITRAVGGDDTLDIDVERASVRAGDRYLLCTDGLYGEISEEQIVGALSIADPSEACRRLLDSALAGEARDNLTAVVVFVDAGEGVRGGIF